MTPAANIKSLKEYNAERNALLGYGIGGNVTDPDDVINDEENEESKIKAGIEIEENSRTGNIEISLFWEEKFMILLRTI